MIKLLVVGNKDTDVKLATDIAASAGAKVAFASDIDMALNYLLNAKGADLIFIDVKMDIAKFCSLLTNEHIHTQIIAYGVNATPKEAVTSIKSGAQEFIPLPPDEKIIAAILASVSKNEKTLYYNSKNMQEVMNVANKVAPSDAHVLITGKSGTGKEVLANYIHTHSKRVNGPFVRVNCAAIPDNLLESELFGHEKGAFTGALFRRIGKFEESNHGTLLLDEISEMDVRLQAKLLRAIQEKEIDRIGGSSPQKVDLRIIATSNRNISEEISKGRFREDLYFRLNIINIKLPNLCDRQEDIEGIANFFVTKYASINGLPQKYLHATTMQKILEYDWPGNVRELENTIHRSVLLSNENEIMPQDLYIEENQTSDPGKNFVADTLRQCLQNPIMAANILGVSISAFKKQLEDILEK